MIQMILEIVNTYLLPGLFIYSTFVLLVNLLFMVSLFAKTTLDVPVWRFFKPQSRFNFYFASLYQLFYWCSYLDIMNYLTLNI